jgi:hypothetical protein
VRIIISWGNGPEKKEIWEKHLILKKSSDSTRNMKKTAIVTGGARGKRLLAAWFAVVVADIDTEAGEETMQEFHSSDELLLIPADVADAFPGYQPRP